MAQKSFTLDGKEIAAALQELKALITVLKQKGVIAANDVKDIDISKTKYEEKA